MTKETPRHSPNHDVIDLEKQNVQTAEMLATALSIHSPQPVRDLAFGDGHRIALTWDASADLEYYPEFGVLRLTMQNARIELYRQADPQERDGMVVFDHSDVSEELQLAITREGEIALKRNPTPVVAELPSDEALTSKHPDTHDAEKTMEFGTSDGVEDNDRPAVATPTAGSNERKFEEQPRITILGRVGRDPRFRESRKGTKVATFPVAVHEDDGTTTWHRVAVFNERASQIEEQSLQQGDRVEIIGYLHERQRRRRDGTPYTSQELYAAVIKLR